MTSHDAQAKTYYERDSVADAYADRLELDDAERAILERLDQAGRLDSVLDLGVGAGRTTGWLRDRASTYVALDFARSMLDRCRVNYPAVPVLQADGRRLPFNGQRFGVVLASFNMLDDVAHDDRQTIIAESFRVLEPGGVFVFSSHNRQHRYPSPWFRYERRHDRRTSAARHHRRALKRYLAGNLNWLRNRSSLIERDEYAVRADYSVSYRLPTYVITPEKQRDQLVRHGFDGGVQVVDGSGAIVGLDTTSTEPWLHYVATKPEGAR